MNREAWETLGNYTANVLMVIGLIVAGVGIFDGIDWLVIPSGLAMFTASGIWIWLEWAPPFEDEEEEELS